MSSFAIISLEKRQLVALTLLSSCCHVALPHDVVGWSVVCDFGISWSYLLFESQDGGNI